MRFLHELRHGCKTWRTAWQRCAVPFRWWRWPRHIGVLGWQRHAGLSGRVLWPAIWHLGGDPEVSTPLWFHFLGCLIIFPGTIFWRCPRHRFLALSSMVWQIWWYLVVFACLGMLFAFGGAWLPAACPWLSTRSLPGCCSLPPLPGLLVWWRGGSERRLRGGGFVEGWGACVPPLGPTLKLQQGFFDVLWTTFLDFNFWLRQQRWLLSEQRWSMTTVSYYLLASTLRKLSFLIKNLALWRSGDVSLPHFWL